MTLRTALATVCALISINGFAQETGLSFPEQPPSLEPALQETPAPLPDPASPSTSPENADTQAPLNDTEASDLPRIELPAETMRLEEIDLTKESQDIFQRMRNGFSIPDIHSDLVLYHQQWYLNRPDYLRRMVERSGRYLHHILEEIEKRGMPTELALLPMVESAYNPMAYSRARASGLWQFIPATGKRFKLDQNWWVDERRDIVASTAAALDYLQEIYEMHGDWHLALASYNWGEGAVGRALQKNRDRGLPTDYLSLTMPGETKNYVPKLQALKNIFSDPGQLIELGLPKIPNSPYFSTVTSQSHIDVKIAAKLAEMPVQDFVALNPAHNRPVITSDTPLVIPAEKLETFTSNLEAHEEENKPLSSWRSYTVRPGDKLEKIAPRFGMSVANLKAINGIKGRISIRPGITLLVAGEGNIKPADMNALPEQVRPAAESSGIAGKGRTHLVRKGETLPALARRYATSVAELKRLNGLRSDRIAPGTRLQIAGAVRTPPSRENAKSVRPVSTPASHKVRRGENLATIARKYGLNRDTLAKVNRVSEDHLKPGMTLRIPSK